MATLRDIMTRDVATLDAEMTLREAIEALRASNVTGAPVTQGSRVVGVVSVADILDFEVETPAVPAERAGQVVWGGLEEEGPDPEVEVSGYYRDMWDDAGAEVVERFAADTGPEWDLLSEHEVGEIMTTTVLGMPPDTSLRSAALFMTAHGIHRILVLEEEELLGIVSASDFVRAIAGGEDLPDS